MPLAMILHKESRIDGDGFLDISCLDSRFFQEGSGLWWFNTAYPTYGYGVLKVDMAYPLHGYGVS
nr:hypothetical protein [Tanacetum cinerariifolium]